MALAAATVWEVRPTNGSDTNGGGFVTGASGTDFSQQNAKNTGTTDKSVTDGVGVGTTTFTSATANFTTAIVGNVIYINGGWYQVTARASSLSITLDRSPGTGTGWTVNIGGALQTVATAIANATVAGMIAYCKAESSYTTTAVVTLLTTGFSPPIRLVGYTTTRTDNGKFTWTTATNSIKLINPSSSFGYSFENFNFTSTAGTPGDCFHPTSGNATNLRIKNCIISGFNVGVNGNFAVDWAIDGLLIEDTEIKGSVSHGIFNSGLTTLVACAIHNNGGSGVVLHANSGFNTSLFASFCAFKSNTADGVNIDSFVHNGFLSFINCDFVNNGGDGINCAFGTGGNNIVLRNCIFYGNTTYQVSGSNSTGLPGLTGFSANGFGANGTGQYNNCPSDPTDITLTADPFTSRTGTPPDLSLNSTAGGGALLKGVATPGTLPFS
jgi:hypothetical protein